ncbi:hypothetical protein BDK88_4287 [Natrinema hispanicum]|uniref:Uncharacterized protein n=1 Tax=Natrinema hispanicum TaxID=392421 RepID=A0A482Y1C3_9EURY|nr:hypothetical protein [Natrinema hispanicum]RZV05261.1 hypothetical protein BDK88_4287 [Natrinema hispanicum]
MKARTLLGISLLAALLLLGAIIYPGALIQPYSGESEYYSIAHESSEAFNETIEEENLSTSDALSVEDLSQSEQRAFTQAQEQTPTEDDYGPNGWQSLGEPPVCDNTLLLCNEYEEMPAPSNDVYTVVEDTNGELYLVRVSFDIPGPALDGFDMVIEFFVKLAILGPYAFFLIYRVWTVGPPDPTLSSAGYGMALVVTVFAYPYLLMFTDISLPSWHLHALAAITWAMILVEILRGRNEIESETGQISD